MQTFSKIINILAIFLKNVLISCMVASILVLTTHNQHGIGQQYRAQLSNLLSKQINITLQFIYLPIKIFFNL